MMVVRLRVHVCVNPCHKGIAAACLVSSGYALLPQQVDQGSESSPQLLAGTCCRINGQCEHRCSTPPFIGRFSILLEFAFDIAAQAQLDGLGQRRPRT